MILNYHKKQKNYFLMILNVYRGMDKKNDAEAEFGDDQPIVFIKMNMNIH